MGWGCADAPVLTWHETCPRLSYNRCGARTNGSLVGRAGRKPPYAGTEPVRSLMTIFDLIKATVVCGAIAFLFYSSPTFSQIVLIAFLSVLWLLYAHKTIARLRRR